MLGAALGFAILLCVGLGACGGLGWVGKVGFIGDDGARGCDVRLVSLINFATLSSTACLDGRYSDGWYSDGWYSDGWYCGLELWEG